ncbi:MAG: hypothetical protein ACJA1C_001050 [Crocinitomicaceae bacterium]|jgi:hypothetical protein
MNNPNILTRILYAILLFFRAIIWVFRKILKRLCKIWCTIKKSIAQRAYSRRVLANRDAKGEVSTKLKYKYDNVPCRKVKDTSCIKIPVKNRARPDPYIYSQDWLKLRGMGYTWNNPDFKLINAATNQETNNRNLEPNTTYRIEATIHNHSTMAALDTRVDFETRSFGISGGLISGPGFAMVDVPAGGNTIASVDWTTPAEIGHVCLIAQISHYDDANSLNNKGQHNTDIVNVGAEAGANTFEVQNQHRGERNMQFKMDAYRLPAQPMRAKSFEEMRSKAYLDRLKRANAPSAFPLPEGMNARILDENGENITNSSVRLAPGEKKILSLEFDSSNVEDGQYVNIHGIDESGLLLGGVTLIVNKQ